MCSHKSYSFWQQFLAVLTLISLIVTGVFSPLFSSSVYADSKNQHDLAVIVVEEDLFGQIQSRIERYAEDIRKSLNNTKVKILRVDTKTTAIEIRDVLEKLYFDGDVSGNDQSHLKGVILIGNIPHPEIQISYEFSLPSYAPYTDFEDKSVVYDPKDQLFHIDNDDFKPEVWHGVIPHFEKKEDLIKYFDEDHKYYTGEKKLNKSVWYADFVAESKALNENQYDLYQNTQKYAEDIAYKRFTGKFMSSLMGGFRDSVFREPSAVDQQLGDIKKQKREKEGACLWGVVPNPQNLVQKITSVAPENTVPDIYSILPIKQYLPEYANVVQSFIRKLQDSVDASGRWEAKDTDYFAKQITLRDIEMREKLKDANERMKKALTNYIQNEWQVDVSVPVELKETGAQLKYYPNYLYGIPASEIKTVYDCSWLRGTPQKNSSDISQLIEMNRTFDVNAKSCNGYGGCCLQNAMNPGSCTPQAATSSVISIYGSNLSSQSSAEAASFKNCLLENWKGFTGDRKNTTVEMITKKISSAFVHDEPRDETISTQIQAKFVRNLPVDAVPYIDFQDKDLQYRRIDFPNIFKSPTSSTESFLKATTQDIQDSEKAILSYQSTENKKVLDALKSLKEIRDSYNAETQKESLDSINAKIKELEWRLSTLSMSALPDGFFEQLFTQDEVKSLDVWLAWKNFSVTQKYHFLSLVNLFQADPAATQNELAYIRGKVQEGNLLLDFDHSNSVTDDLMFQMWQDQKQAETDALTANNQAVSSGGQGPSEQCGSYDGVEIWEWPAAVMCWLKSLKDFKIIETKSFEQEWKTSWDAFQSEIQGFENRMDTLDAQQETLSQKKVSSSLNTSSNTSIGSFSTIAPVLTEPVSGWTIPEKFSLIVSPSDKEPYLFTLPIHVFTNSQKLYSGFKEITIELPQGLKTQEQDIDDQQPGLQLPVIAGELLVPLSASEVFQDKTLKITLDGKVKQVLVSALASVSVKVNIENIHSDQETATSSAILNVHFDPAFYGDIPLNFSSDSRIHFLSTSGSSHNGYLEMPIVFQTSKENLPFTISSPYFSAYSFTLPSRSQEPAKFLLQGGDEFYVQSGTEFPLEIQVVDAFLKPINEDVQFELYVTPLSNNYTSLKSQEIIAKKGKASIRIDTLAEHGDIHIALMKQGMESKIITVKSRTKIRPDDIKTMSSAFSFFVHESSPDAHALIEKMLLSGSMAVAERAPHPKEALARLEILPNGEFINRDENIRIEDRGNFSLAAFHTATLEQYAQWKLLFSKNPTISLTDPAAEIFVKPLITTGISFEKNILSYEKTPIVRIDKNGISILDNRFGKKVTSDKNTLFFDILYGDQSIVSLLIHPKRKEFLGKNPLLKEESNIWKLLGIDIDDSLSHEDFLGWQGDDTSILEAAARTIWGKAFLDHQSLTDVFWGDPVLSYNLKTEDLTVSKYDSTIGKVLYRGDEALSVFQSFDYNKDGNKDIIAAEGENNLVLLEGSKNGNMILRGKYGLAAEGITQIETGDFLGDGFDDILVATKGGKVYLFDNKEGHIVPEKEALITDAREIYSMQVKDFDGDKLKDIALSTSRGELVVHYGNKKGFETKPQIIKSAGIILNHEDAGKDVLVSVPANTDTLSVFVNREKFMIAGINDVNKDGIKDLLLTKPGAETSKTQEGYTIIPTDAQVNPTLALGNTQNTFKVGKESVQDKNGNSIKASTVVIPDFITVTVPKEFGSDSLKLPVRKQSRIQKYYSSSDRNSIDLYSRVTVDIHIPSGVLEKGAYIVDSLAPFLEFINDSAQCNKKSCQTVLSKGEQTRVIFGPFSDSSDRVIQYQAMIRLTPKISFEYNAETKSIEISELKKQYKTDSHRIWKESDIPLNSNVSVIANNSSSFERTVTDALSDSWGMAHNNSEKSAQVLGIEDKLRQGLNLLENLNCSRGNCFDFPVNKAFLVPGTWSVAPMLLNAAKGAGFVEGLAQGVNNALDRVGVPLGPNPSPTPLWGIKTCVGPIPVQPCVAQSCYQDVATGCVPTASPLDFRMYLSPTLTGGLGMAMCHGPAYLTALLSTVPTVPQCMAFALPVSDVIGACQSVNTNLSNLYDQAKSAVSSSGKKTTLFQMDGALKNTTSGAAEGYAGFTIGLETLDRLLSGERLQNKSTYPFPKGLFIRWWDAQKSQFAKLLNLPTITLYYPQMEAVLLGGKDDQGMEIKAEKSEVGKLKEAWNNFQSPSKTQSTQNTTPIPAKKTSTSSNANTVGGSLIGPVQQGLSSVNNKLISPVSNNIESLQQYVVKQKESVEGTFQGIFDIIENIPFVSLERKPVDILVPWMNPQELNSLIAELEFWLKQNEKEINRFVDQITKIQKQCSAWKAGKSESLSIGVDAEVCKKMLNVSAGVDLKNFLLSIHKNLDILKQYREYPQTLAKYKTQLAYYLVDALKYVNALMDVLGGWISRNKAIADRYVMLYKTVQELIKAWDSISLIFSLYQASCDTCKADVYSQNFSLYNLLFGFIPSPPVVVFPRWPDIILDLSHIQAGIKISIPELRFHVKEISFEFDLQPIRLPKLDFNANLNFAIPIPQLPVLPELPPLPSLPRFPNFPLPQLPDLPPPPKLPKLLDCISQWTDVIKLLLRLYCLITNGLWVYPESQLTQIIEALTNRSALLSLPVDFLQLQWPDISYPWIDSINVDGYLTVEPKIDVLQEPVEGFADTINQYSTGVATSIQHSLNEGINSVSQTITNNVNSNSDAVDQKVNQGLRNLQEKLDDKATNLGNKLMNDARGSSLRVPSLKNYYQLAKLLKEQIQKEQRDTELLANTQTIKALAQYTNSKTILAANDLQSSDLTLKTQINSATQNIAEAQAQTEKILKGLFVYNTQSHTQEVVIKNTEQAKELSSPKFIDINGDNQEDILYVRGNKLYVKYSYQKDPQLTPYPEKIEIDNLRQDKPLQRAANNFQVSSANEMVTFSWKDEEDAMGYVLEKKPMVFGYDADEDTLSEYVFLLKSPFFQKEQTLIGKEKISVGKTSYTIRKGETAQVLHFDEPRFSWAMPNDFYYSRMYVLNKDGYVSTSSEQRLLAPQKAWDTQTPQVLSNPVSQVPVLKEWPIESGIVNDDSGLSYKWDIDKNGTIDYSGKVFSLPAQENLGQKTFDVVAEDSAGNKTLFQKKINIYAPHIHLTQVNNQGVQGYIDEKIPFMPFALLRKRGNSYRLITPKNKSRFYTDLNGNFSIAKNTQISGLIVKNSLGKTIASIQESGGIKLYDNRIQLTVIPSTSTMPLQVLVLNSQKELLARISYIASSEKVSIVQNSNELQNTSSVAIYDVDTKDSLKLSTISDTAKYFAKGVALSGIDGTLYAAVSPQGAVRILDSRIHMGIAENQNRLLLALYNSQQKELARFSLGNLPMTVQESKGLPSESFLDHFIEWISKAAKAAEDTTQIAGEKAQKTLALPFSDLNPSNPYYQAIKDLYERNILKGYDDGSYHPNAKITRAEFVKIALGATTCFDCASPTEETKKEFTSKKPFPDVNLVDWFYYCISIAKKEKMVTGYGDGMFHPTKNISRKEAAAVLLRQISAKLDTMPKNTFRDVPDYDWAKDYVYTAVKLGIIKNQGGFTFPNEEITRGEFAMMASRILELRACQIRPEYQDTHNVLVGKKPSENTKKPIPSGIIHPQNDGTMILEKPDGTKMHLNKDGTPVDQPKDTSVLDTVKDFAGICSEFKNGLCPVLPESFKKTPGVLVETPYQSIYPPLSYPKAQNIQCLFTDSLEDFLPGDQLSAIIIASDNRRIFSKSNELMMSK